jgi:hypothetical protein
MLLAARPDKSLAFRSKTANREALRAFARQPSGAPRWLTDSCRNSRPLRLYVRKGYRLMAELIPLGFGFLLGILLGLLRSSLRLPVGMVLAVALGTLATVVTGEAQISWGFVMVDIPIVAIGSALGLLAGGRLGAAVSTSGSDGP